MLDIAAKDTLIVGMVVTAVLTYAILMFDRRGFRPMEIIIGAFTEVYDVSVKEGIDMRMAAFMVGLRRLGKAASIRGVYP